MKLLLQAAQAFLTLLRALTEIKGPATGLLVWCWRYLDPLFGETRK